MTVSRVTDNQQAWDAFILREGGSFLQSWGWSLFQEKLGRAAYRFRIDRGEAGDAVAQFVAIDQALPFGFRYLYVPRGPVIASGNGEAMDSFVSAVREAMAERGEVFAKIEFPNRAQEDRITADALRERGFVQSKTSQPADTSIVDLRRGEAELLAAMHHKTRYNIRLAERHGVTIREAQYADEHLLNHDIDTFWNLLGQTAERDKFHTHDKQYYETMLKTLAPGRAGEMKVRLVFAQYQGQAVAANIMVDFGSTTTYLHGASDAVRRQIMAPNLLQWTLMLDAKRRGATMYDFWGVAPSDDAEHPWAGITRFKKGFGGERVSYLGAWELPGRSVWYSLYRLAKRLK